MTILSACQDASKEMGLSVPSSIYTSSDKYATELGSIANEAATYIAKNYDWRLFLILKTIAGDGATTAFTLPTDYDRMPVKAQIWRASTVQPMEGVQDLDEWRFRRLRNANNPSGEWILLTGSLQIFPVMSLTDSASFYYCSNKIVNDAGLVTKAAFTADTDVFRLPERLIKLALKWRWRAMKRLDSADEQEEYEIAQAQEIVRDKGSRMIRIGRGRIPDGVRTAYPGVISA